MPKGNGAFIGKGPDPDGSAHGNRRPFLRSGEALGEMHNIILKNLNQACGRILRQNEFWAIGSPCILRCLVATTPGRFLQWKCQTD
jgi:hypothetical protein